MRLSISLKVGISSGWLVLTVADVREVGLGFGGGVGRTLSGTPLTTFPVHGGGIKVTWPVMVTNNRIFE